MSISATYQRFKILPYLATLLILVQIVNSLFGNIFLAYGIYPRDMSSLPFIFTAPFIHGGFAHLIGNLFGLFVFGGLCLLQSKDFFLQNSIFIIAVSGLLVWLFGRDAYHAGMSGLIFGLWSLLIARAYFQANFTNVLLAVVVVLFYGGMVFGLLPARQYVSFESHIAGAFAGGLCAYLNKVLA